MTNEASNLLDGIEKQLRTLIGDIEKTSNPKKVLDLQVPILQLHAIMALAFEVRSVALTLERLTAAIERK